MRGLTGVGGGIDVRRADPGTMDVRRSTFMIHVYQIDVAEWSRATFQRLQSVDLSPGTGRHPAQQLELRLETETGIRGIVRLCHHT